MIQEYLIHTSLFLRNKIIKKMRGHVINQLFRAYFEQENFIIQNTTLMIYYNRI